MSNINLNNMTMIENGKLRHLSSCCKCGTVFKLPVNINYIIDRHIKIIGKEPIFECPCCKTELIPNEYYNIINQREMAIQFKKNEEECDLAIILLIFLVPLGYGWLWTA